MSYTATFDASHKVKAAGPHRVNFERHIARDVDQAHGFIFGHQNPNIDPARTRLNITRVNDGHGGFRKLAVTESGEGKPRPPSAEISDYLGARLGTVKSKLRKDAVVMRPVVLQLDPEWFEEHNPSWRMTGLNSQARKHVSAQLKWARQEFGHENLVAYSMHLDETSPQLQLLVTPVTNDGRLSQNDFFKGPSDLRRQHKESREALAASGYQVDFSVSSRSTEHLSSAEYAAKSKAVHDKAVEVDARDAKVTAHARRIEARERGLRELEAEGFERGWAEGRDAAESAARADLMALDLIPDDDTPILPRRRAPKREKKDLTPARERYLEYTRQRTK